MRQVEAFVALWQGLPYHDHLTAPEKTVSTEIPSVASFLVVAWVKNSPYYVPFV